MKRMPLEVQLRVKAEARLNPSEDQEKVTSAITNVLDNCRAESKHGKIVCESLLSESLNTIYEQVRSRAALGVLRRILLYNRSPTSTWFFLNKQAAACGTVVVVEEVQESPLGPIKVVIECEEVDK